MRAKQTVPSALTTITKTNKQTKEKTLTMPKSRPQSIQDWKDEGGDNQEKRQKKSREGEESEENMDAPMVDAGMPSPNDDEGIGDDEEMTTPDETRPPSLDSLLGTHLQDDDFVEGVAVGDKKTLKTQVKVEYFFDEHDRTKLDQDAITAQQKHLQIDLDCFLTTGKKRTYSQPNSNTSGLRLASQNYGFGEKLTHHLDIEAFLDRLIDVSRWHYNDTDRDKYLAPLLPVVQSSGTGKSRLLYEVRNNLRSQGWPCRSILLTDQDPVTVRKELAQNEQQGNSSQSYDEVFKVEEAPEEEKANLRTNFRRFVLQQCSAACKDSEKVDDGNKKERPDPNHVFLFFDEAQHLTVDKGFLFRVLRWILQEFPQSRTEISVELKITVVLAGTNSALTNFFAETEVVFNSSRYLQESLYFEKGKKPYPPFFLLRTQGCFASKGGNVASNASIGVSTGSVSEYEAMIRHSRPLFHLLHREDKLKNDQEFDIALKILLGHGSTWKDNERSCLSVLATRVQMGVTSTDVVSDLVSKGYAHLTYFQNKSSADSGIPSRASFAFLPDPVCARIAMLLTDEDFEITMQSKNSSPRHSKPIAGIKKTEIVWMMGRIFSTGLCLPAKGDVGEIAISLYLLFCGDVLRKQRDGPPGHFFSNQRYHQLSVGVGSWMDLVWNGGHSIENSPSIDCPWNKFTINCIQFFRYSVRSSFAEMSNSVFLESLYSKGCAIYCPTNFPAVDTLIPCCYCQEEQKKYLPVFFSYKNYAALYTGEAFKFLLSSWKALKEKGISNGLLILGIAGQDREDVDVNVYENEWLNKLDEKDREAYDALITRTNKADFSEKLRVGFVCVHKDTFGINEMLQGLATVKDQQIADIYSVHSELIHKAPPNASATGQDSELEATQSYRKDATTFYKTTLGMVVATSSKDTADTDANPTNVQRTA